MKNRRMRLRILRIIGLVLTIVVCCLFLKGTRFSQLVGFYFYMSAACTLIPLPTPPFVIKMGELYHPGIVALVGALGNCTAGYIEYHFLTWFFTKIELKKRLEKNWYYQQFANFFKRSAFLCIVITGFIPLYMEPFRVAAILTRFVLHKYLLAIFIGKLPRIYLMAMIGDTLHIPTHYFILFLLALFITPWLFSLFMNSLRKRKVMNKKEIKRNIKIRPKVDKVHLKTTLSRDS